MDGDESHTVAPQGAPALTGSVAENLGFSASLVDSLDELTPQAVSRSWCTFGVWLATLTPDERAAVAAKLADRRYASTDLLPIFRKFGLTVGTSSLQRHRRGGCLCPR